MQQLTLKEKWLANGAKIVSLPMCDYVASVSDVNTEMNALRNSVVLSDISYMKKLAFDEAEGAEFLDEHLAGNVLKLRYGKAMQTFLADANGDIAADITLANIDDKIFLFAETIDDSAFECLCPTSQNLDTTHTLLSIDGPEAWKIAKKIFGADIYNLSFMTVEKYSYENSDAIVMRAGKTGEFGYQILVPNTVAEKLFDEIHNAIKEFNGRLAGVDTLLSARAKGNFFNIFGEGKKVKNPFELGLQWQIDFDKEIFDGSEKILQNRQKQQANKLIAIQCQEPVEVGTKIFNNTEEVGEVVSIDLADKNFALAIVNFDVAYVGQDFAFQSAGNDACKTVSRPSIIAQSLLRGMDD